MRSVDRYLIATWPLGTTGQTGEGHFARLAGALGWQVVIHEPGLGLAVPMGSQVRLRRLRNGRGVVIGDLFSKLADAPAPGAWLSFPEVGLGSGALFRSLTGEFWGRYVAVHLAHASANAAIFRDPSGALDSLCWQAEGASFAASDMLEDAPPPFRPQVRVAWGQVRALLADFAGGAALVPLTGVVAVGPGEMVDMAQLSRASVWRPASYVSRQRRDATALQAELRMRIDHVVTSLSSDSNQILADISGGLDSAIVATALHRAAPDKVVQWLNFRVADPQGDERAFARAVAAKLGVKLTEVTNPELRLTREHLDVVGRGPRPSVMALDFQSDGDNAERSAALGIDAIFTGQGGDAVFLQTRSPRLATDAVLAGVRGVDLARIQRQAAWAARVSLWAIFAAGVRARFAAGPARRAPPPFLRSSGGKGPSHPWLDDAARAPPAKSLQIHALTSSQLFHGHSRRGQVARVVQPLLAQPVVELCLSIPSFDLTLGDNDRALARAAFAERLPTELIHRRSKGDLSSYYGRMLANSLDVLRPYLLEGTLAGQRLLDLDWLDEALRPESLLWRDLAADLMELVAVESWTRHWSARTVDSPFRS